MCIVSVIIPTYNSHQYIAKTLNSVLRQTTTDFEILVIDDFSSDNTVEIVKSFVQQDSRIILTQLRSNYGAAVARNTGIEQAKGRYIAFLDSDDKWLPNKLTKQIDFMEKNNIALAYTAYRKVNVDGKYLGSIGVPSKVSYRSLLKKCDIGCLTAIYDTERIGKVYMPDIRKRQDLGLWLKILKKIPYAYGINEILAEYTVRSDSISSNKCKAAVYTWRLYRDVEKLSVLKASYYFSCYAVNGILRTKFPGIARRLGVLK